MRSILLGVIAALALAGGALAQTSPPAAPAKPGTIKTRLDHLSGTKWVLILSYLPSEITSVTCDKWTMLGVGSYKHQNEFTIPGGPSVAIMDASGFDGYCRTAGSIRAHTDDGDFTGALDRGDGEWNGSTKLTFNTAH